MCILTFCWWLLCCDWAANYIEQELVSLQFLCFPLTCQCMCLCVSKVAPPVAVQLLLSWLSRHMLCWLRTSPHILGMQISNEACFPPHPPRLMFLLWSVCFWGLLSEHCWSSADGCCAAICYSPRGVFFFFPLSSVVRWHLFGRGVRWEIEKGGSQPVEVSL